MDSYVATRPCTYKNLALRAGDVVRVEEGTAVKHFALRKLGKKDEPQPTGGASYEVPKTPASSLGEAKEVDSPVIRRFS